ncbi:hypothetical protein MTO96_037280 [Rhipicephalus appendiculatus]
MPYCTDDCLLGHLTRESMNLDLLTQAISGNERLEELRVDLYTTPLSKCQRFFEALRENTTLRRVTVTRFPNRQAAALCQAIRHSGVQERVNISWPYIFEEPLDMTAECTSVSSVILPCNELRHMPLLYGALTLLPRWNHIRHLSVRLLSDQLCSMYKHLLFYLQTATNLRSLCLDVTGRVGRDIRRKLLMVLLSCCRMQQLKIVGGLVLDAYEAMDVAHALCLNDNLSDFCFFEAPGPEGSDGVAIERILRHLAPCISRNLTLCFLEHDMVMNSKEFHEVHSVVRRNRALAMNAAHFVLGKNTSDYCAKAFSLVRNCPQLLFNVMAMASLDEAEAASCIQRTLTSL